jgi:HPt (histidine-containing phosphotransfer) domain-containing protein
MVDQVAPTLDRTVLEDMVTIVGPSMIPGLRVAIAQYLEQIPVALAALRTAIAHNDAETLRQAAHALRSSSLNLGALRIAQVCEQLEYQAIAQANDTAIGPSPPSWDSGTLAQKLLDLEQAAEKIIPLLTDLQL